jgi:hypothetical protein
MADRFVKHKTSGLVLIRAQPWIGHADFEECADALGNTLTAKQRKALAALDAGAAEAAGENTDGPAADGDTDVALSTEARRGYP